MISHLGAMISVVNGILMARQMKGLKGSVGAACIGDGATSTGACHEALNQAAIEKLPLVLVVADNQYAYSTPTSRQFACQLVDRAIGYGVRGYNIDGTDLAVCLTTMAEAIQRAREGEGPQLVVANLLRLCGHGEHDDAGYVEAKLKQSPIGRDCMKVAEERILHQAWANASQLDGWRHEVILKVEDAIAKVQREAGPDPFKEDWYALSCKHLNEGHGDV
jgi:pyruvate dehydrogenase E1 component alpha subunit/2-oxoisovalerate dehydrogenase E1 component alpha subunit